MKQHNEALFKHFASVLKKRATGQELQPEVDKKLLQHLSRKQLIDILMSKWKQVIPKNLNLMELENSELLLLIGDELYILAHLSSLWCMELDKSTLTNHATKDKVETQVKKQAVSASKKDSAGKLPTETKKSERSTT